MEDCSTNSEEEKDEVKEEEEEQTIYKVGQP